MGAERLALGAECVEAPEDCLFHPDRHAGALIVDADNDSGAVPAEPERDRPASRAERAGVADEILEHLGEAILDALHHERTVAFDLDADGLGNFTHC